jgi:methyltransferase (TIGR00027 family)
LGLGFRPAQPARHTRLGAALPREEAPRPPLDSTTAGTRYIDDVVARGLADDVEQIVILGAGYDSRPYRPKNIERCRVFEVDHPDTQARKRRRLRSGGLAIPPHVSFVPIDLARACLDDVLPAQGFRRDRRSLFIWEGVSEYLSADAVDATLRPSQRSSLPAKSAPPGNIR